MPELIEKERAYTALKHEQYTHGLSFSAEAFEKAARIIDQMPTIEPKVRHGRWISLDGWFNKSIVKCSACGNTLDMDGVNAGRGDANFCPNCGAKMGGADNGN